MEFFAAQKALHGHLKLEKWGGILYRKQTPRYTASVLVLPGSLTASISVGTGVQPESAIPTLVGNANYFELGLGSS